MSNEGNSGNAYQTDYFYETDGQLSRVTGPGLPAYGATHNYLTNSSMLDRIDFKTSSTTTVATADLDYESNRDLLTAVTNKWGSWIDQELAGCAFPDERLGRRFGVLMAQLAKGLGQTLPLACGDWSRTEAAYRLLAILAAIPMSK